MAFCTWPLSLHTLLSRLTHVVVCVVLHSFVCPNKDPPLCGEYLLHARAHCRGTWAVPTLGCGEGHRSELVCSVWMDMCVLPLGICPREGLLGLTVPLWLTL